MQDRDLLRRALRYVGQTELAAALGVSRMTLWRYENMLSSGVGMACEPGDAENVRRGLKDIVRMFERPIPEPPRSWSRYSPVPQG